MAMGLDAGITVSTVWKAERATGKLATFEALASTMGMAISGTALPPGVNVAARLLALRTRRGLGRRVVADLAGVSPTTLATLERGADTHLPPSSPLQPRSGPRSASLPPVLRSHIGPGRPPPARMAGGQRRRTC